MARAGKSKAPLATIEVPEQDVVLTLESEEEVSSWFQTQQAFWEKLEAEVGGGIVLSNHNLGVAKPFFNKVRAVLSAARSAVFAESKTAFVEMVAYAQRLQLILAGGSIADAMQDARTAGRRDEVLAFLYAYGQPFWPPEFRERNFLMPLAAALVAGHPAWRLLAYSGQIVGLQKETSVLYEEQASKIAEMQEAKQEFDERIAHWSSELEELKKLYEAHISLEAPATYWDRRRRVATWIAVAADSSRKATGLLDRSLPRLGRVGVSGPAHCLLERHSPERTYRKPRPNP